MSACRFEDLQPRIQRVLPTWRFNGITREIKPGMSYLVDEAKQPIWFSREETASFLKIPVDSEPFQIVRTSVSAPSSNSDLSPNALRFSSESGFSIVSDVESKINVDNLPAGVKLAAIFKSDSKAAVNFDLTNAEEFSLRNKSSISHLITQLVVTDEWPLNRRLVVSSMKASSMVYGWSSSENACYGIGIDANGHLVDITSKLKFQLHSKAAQSGSFPNNVPNGRYTGIYQPMAVRIRTNKETWEFWKPTFIEDSGTKLHHLYSQTKYGKRKCPVELSLLNPAHTREVKSAEEVFPENESDSDDDGNNESDEIDEKTLGTKNK